MENLLCRWLGHRWVYHRAMTEEGWWTMYLGRTCGRCFYREDFPEARRYWLQITEATGKEPYAMFRRSKRKQTIQYCVLDGHGGWMDADTMLRRSAKPTVVKAEA